MQNKGRWTLCLNMDCPKKASRNSKKEQKDQAAEKDKKA